MALTNPKTTAAIKAAGKLSTLKPDTRLAVITSDTAVSTQVNKKRGMTFLEQRLSVSYLESDPLGATLCIKSRLAVQRFSATLGN